MYGLVSECFFYGAPGLEPFNGGGEPTPESSNQGEPRHDHLFDSTLPKSITKLAETIVSEVFPAGRDWAEIHAGQAIDQMQGGVNSKTQKDRLVQMIQDTIFEQVHASNFYLSIGMMVKDAVIGGTGIIKVMLSSDASKIIEFKACSQFEVALEVGHSGDVIGFFRKAWMTREEIRTAWPDIPESKLPQEDDDERERYSLTRYQIHDCYYYDSYSGVWLYDILLDGGSTEQASSERIREEEHPVPLWIAYRYELTPDEIYGRTPTMSALPDARTVNHAIKVRLKSASMRAVSAFTHTGGDGFNPRTLKIESGAVIRVESNSNDNPTLRPLEVGGDVNLNEIVIEDFRTSIKETMLDNPLPPPSGSVRSATEIIERQREAHAKVGNPLRRAAEEVGPGILRAVGYLLALVGKLQGVEQVTGTDEAGNPLPLLFDGSDVGISFVSPMVNAQNLSDAQSLTEWATASQQAFGVEAFVDGVKVEDGPAELSNLMGVGSMLVRSPEERQERSKQRQEAAMAEQGAQQPQGAPPQ